MRIYFITSSTNKSGGSRQALYLAQALAQRGHEMAFFVPEKAELPSLDPDMSWRPLPARTKDWGKAVFAQLPHDGRTPFILHAYHNKAVKKAAWWGLFLHRRNGVVAAQRGVIYKPNNPLPYWSPGVDCFMANSQACAKVLKKKGVGEKRLHVVYNGIPRERLLTTQSRGQIRSELGVDDDTLLFGSVANDSANKGAEEMIRALAACRDTKARLLILGVKQEKWAPIAREVGVEERVLMPGRTENVADYLQAMDVFTLASHSESMPNTLQEAMLMGLPAIATNVGGVPECINGNGLLIPPKDVPALTRAFDQAAQSREQRRAWAKRSIELSRVFAMEHKVTLVESIYSECLTKRGLAPLAPAS